MKEINSFEAAANRRADGGGVLALACLAILLALAFNPAVFNDGDTSWHVAAGRLILERGAVPHSDPFSFTFAGTPWVAHEWLAEVAMAALFQLGGWSALALMTALAVAAVLAVVGREALRRLKLVPALAPVVAVALVLMPFIVARPHVLAWPILAIWTIMLLRARGRGDAPSPTGALLMLVWANLHGSFVLGLLLVGFFGFEAMIYEANRQKTLQSWGLFGAIAFVAALVTPHGPAGLLFPLQVSQMESLPLIGEWRATDFRDYPAFGLALIVTAALLLSRRVSLPPLRLLLLLALAYLSIEHVRHQAVFAIVGSLILIRAAGQAHDPAPTFPGRIAFAIMLALIGVGVLRLSIPAERPDSASNPLSAIAQVPAELRGQPVLNSYAFGGPLILQGISPYIDGRADMYGDAFLFEHQRLMQGDMPAFRRAAEKWRLKWTIISPLDPLSRKLDSEPGWRRIHADRWAVVHVAE